MADPFDEDLARLNAQLADVDGPPRAGIGSDRAADRSPRAPAEVLNQYPFANALAGGIVAMGSLPGLARNMVSEGINTADRWLNATRQQPGARATDDLVLPIEDRGTENYQLNPNRIQPPDVLAPLGGAALTPVGMLGRETLRGGAKVGRPPANAEMDFWYRGEHDRSIERMRSFVPPSAASLSESARPASAQGGLSLSANLADRPDHFSYRIYKNGEDVGELKGVVRGDVADIDYMGAGLPNSIGVSGVRELREAFRSDFPNVKTFEGGRVSGAKGSTYEGPVEDAPRQSIRLLSDAGKRSSPIAAAANAELARSKESSLPGMIQGAVENVQGNVERAGRPEIVTPASAQVWYHGTSNPSFSGFTSSGGQGSRNSGGSGATFLTPFETEARSAYGGDKGRVVPVHSAHQNAFIWQLDNMPDTLRRARAVLPGLDVSGDAIKTVAQQKQFFDALKRAGFDAVEMRSANGPAELAVFDGAKLKEIGRGDRSSGAANASDSLKRISNPIKVFHGSPHDFDKFDSKHIGSGEGAQAFGHGLYFAENPKIANWYKDKLEIPVDASPDAGFVGGKPFDSSVEHWAALYRYVQNDPRGHAQKNWFEPASNIWGKLDDLLKPKIRRDALAGKKLAESGAELPPFDWGNFDKSVGAGRTYEVALHAEPEKFLDLSIPLQQQSEAVRAALKPIADAAVKDRAFRILHPFTRDISNIKQLLGTAEEGAIEAALKEAGLVGIRYKDAVSRGKEGGTYNYVVFPGADDVIEIIGKDGKPLVGAEKAKAIDELYARQGLPPVSSGQEGASMAQGTDPFDAELELLAQLLAEGGDDGSGGGGPTERRTVPNPTQTLGGRRMEGRRPMTVQEQTMADNPARQMGRDAGAFASSAVNALGLGVPGVVLDYAAPETMAAIRENESLANSGVPFAGSMAGSAAIPVNRLAQGMEAVGRGVASLPAWAKFGGAGLAASAYPTDAQQTTGSTGNPVLDQLLDQQKQMTAQRKAAQAERDLQVKGGGGVKGGRGPNYDAAVRELERLDTELSKISTQIGKVQEGMTPEAKLKAERERKAFEDAELAKEYGKPIREYLPPAVANTLPIAATVAGTLATRGIANKFNAEYNAALRGYREAEKAGDVAEMSLRRAQLAKLEETTVGNTLPTIMAAGLPAEIRLTETVIDANRDPHSRAYKEAWDRIKDPMALSFDVGTSLLSSGVAYGLGTKFSKNPPERSLGQAIVDTPYHKNALGLAEDITNVPRPAGVPNTLAGPESTSLGLRAPTTTGGALQGQGQSVSPQSTRAGSEAGGQSQSGSPQSTRKEASDPQLPPGIKLDKNGVPYDAHTGQKINKRLVEERAKDPRRRAKPDRDDEPTKKSSVQIDDTRPYGRNRLADDD